MRWCIFTDRRCYGEDCTGWIGDNRFIFLLLPADYNDTQQQTEFNWSKQRLSNTDSSDAVMYGDDQLSFLDELERQIARRYSV